MPLNSSKHPESMTNHQKTTLVESLGLNRELSLVESVLLSIGLGWVVSYMERVRVFRKINNTPGMTAKPANNVGSEDFPLLNDGLDYE